MRQVLSRLSRVAALTLLVGAVFAMPAWGDAGDQYTEVVPGPGGDTPTKDVRAGGGNKDDSSDADTPDAPVTTSPPAAAPQVESSSAVDGAAGDSKKTVDPDRKAARSLAKATAPASAALHRAILKEKGLDDERIEARLAQSASVLGLGESSLGGERGLGIAFPLVLGLGLLASFALMWRRRTD